MKNEENTNNKLVGIERYKFGSNDIIGKGSFGSVYKALDLNTNKNVALKQIYFENDDEKSSIINEINLMKNIQSYNTIKLIDNFLDKKCYYIIMELCDDNLHNYVEKKGKLKIEVIQKILIELNVVLRLMKTKNINLGIIKPHNILIKYINKNDFMVKLDFSFGKELNSKNYFTSDKETEIFKAPEVNSGNYDYKADLYSIGIILYYLYFGKYPIKEIKNNYDNIEIKNLINNLREKDYNKRLDWNNYINHPFFINY